MILNSKINEIKELSKTSPVLAVGIPLAMFGESTIIEASIPSKSLGIINTAKGIKAPSWFYGIVKGNESHQIIINNIDSIDKESQEKFYELLKYKAISDVELPADCKLIVLATDLNKVSETILRLCLLVK
jgi:hypothetical protein